MNTASEIADVRVRNADADRTAAPKLRRIAANQPLTVKVIEDFSILESLLDDWDELAAHALEPNPSYESWMLIPALRLLGEQNDLRLALLYATDAERPFGAPILCGLFPLQRTKTYNGLPAKTWRLWNHPYFVICTPLIRKDCAVRCLHAFFDWLAEVEADCTLAEFAQVPGDSAFHQALTEVLYERSALTFTTQRHARALFRPHTDAESYLRNAVSREHRKDLRRRFNRLHDVGRVEYCELTAAENIETWIEAFLSLEESGWKGKQGGAFACVAAHRAYFETIMREAYQRGRLQVLSLAINNHPIALKINLFASPGSFAFKIAFDETFSYYSPGLMLEIENIRRLHTLPHISWSDSCAIPGHPMIDRLWLDRRIIQTVVCATGSRKSDFFVSLLPLLRWLNRQRPSLRKKIHQQKSQGKEKI